MVRDTGRTSGWRQSSRLGLHIRSYEWYRLLGFDYVKGSSGTALWPKTPWKEVPLLSTASGCASWAAVPVTGTDRVPGLWCTAIASPWVTMLRSLAHWSYNPECYIFSTCGPSSNSHLWGIWLRVSMLNGVASGHEDGTYKAGNYITLYLLRQTCNWNKPIYIPGT
jgi:hypothetical protein